MNKNEYQDWICSHKDEQYSIQKIGENEIRLETDCGIGRIVFYENDIIELIITKKENGEPAFYLHFQLRDREHAENLFREMTEVSSSMAEPAL